MYTYTWRVCVLPFSLSTRRVPGICLSLLKCDFLIINCRCCKKKPKTDNNSFRFTVSKSLFTKSQREPEYQAKPWRLMVYAVADIQSSPIEPEMLRSCGVFFLVIPLISIVVCSFVLWSLARRKQLQKATYRMVGYLIRALCCQATSSSLLWINPFISLYIRTLCCQATSSSLLWLNAFLSLYIRTLCCQATSSILLWINVFLSLYIRTLCWQATSSSLLWINPS